jgi:ubiquinol-cytochrome c reductase iron-sulfur subunit
MIMGLSNQNQQVDTQASPTVEVDLTPVHPGQIVTIEWEGMPVFIRRRTAGEIQAARSTPTTELRDPESDEQRVQKSEWLVVVGSCTHRGCVPSNEIKGEYGGWLCTCHGSHYDTSGRIRKGPAPKNLEVPPYRFMSDTKVLIGTAADHDATAPRHE